MLGMLQRAKPEVSSDAALSLSGLCDSRFPDLTCICMWIWRAQNSSSLLTAESSEKKRNKSKIPMEAWVAQNSQTILGRNGGSQNSWSQITLQSHSNKIVWYWHKTRHRPMEYNKGPRNKLTQLQLCDSCQKLQGKHQLLQQMDGPRDCP